MRIGFYHDGVGARHAGGVAIYARRMAVELAASTDVYVYTRKGDLAPSLDRSDARVIETRAMERRTAERLVRGGPISPQDLVKLSMAAASVRDGVVDHVEANVDLLLTFQAVDDLLLSNLVDVPTVRFFLSDFGGSGALSAVRERFARTDFRVANTPHIADLVAGEFDHEVDAILPPGVDAERFHPAADPAFQRDGSTVLFVGRVIESKGIFDLLDAVARLDDVRLRVVGDGEMKAVRRRAGERGIADRVILEGEVPHTELPGYYAAADAFCLPTHADSFAMVNLEAMACATPVVTTDLDGIRTYLRPGTDGAVVAPGNRDELVAALRALLADPERRDEMGAAARDRAEAFTWTKRADQLERFCAAALADEDGESARRRPSRLRSD